MCLVDWSWSCFFFWGGMFFVETESTYGTNNTQIDSDGLSLVCSAFVRQCVLAPAKNSANYMNDFSA